MSSIWKRSGFIYLAILIAVVALATYLFSSSQKPVEIPLSEAIIMSQGNSIEKIVVEG